MRSRSFATAGAAATAAPLHAETPGAGAEAGRGATPPAEVRVARLGRMLRAIGAGVLLAAASTFLLQHWQQGNDLERYAGLLGLTVLLSGAGFLTGLRLRESKGARTFLALAAGVVPAHFCILGGFVYSQLAWGSGPHPVPEYASWVAPSAAAALLTTAGALLALAPVTFVSLLALARSQARVLTAAYLGLGALLLVPTREPGPVAALVAAGVAALALLELRVLRRDLALRTFEGILVRAMLLAPVTLLALRSALHYDLSALFGAVVCAAVAFLQFALSREAQVPRRLRRVLERSCVLPTAGACIYGGVALEAAGLPEVAVIPAMAFPFAGALLGLSVFAPTAPSARQGGAGYRAAGASVATGAAAANVLFFGDAFASLVCLAVAIPTLGYGYAVGRRALFAIGASAAVYALLVHVHAAIRFYAWAGWGGLALLGVAVIVAASLLERHHRAWAVRWHALRARMARWEY